MECACLPACSFRHQSLQSTYFRYCSSHLRGFRIWRRLFERDFPLLMGNAFILDFDLDLEMDETEGSSPSEYHMKRYKRRYRNIFLLKRFLSCGLPFFLFFSVSFFSAHTS